MNHKITRKIIIGISLSVLLFGCSERVQPPPNYGVSQAVLDQLVDEYNDALAASKDPWKAFSLEERVTLAEYAFDQHAKGNSVVPMPIELTQELDAELVKRGIIPPEQTQTKK